jgi:brefeldin A-inhibited guanine nucleotide-exchange protein
MGSWMDQQLRIGDFSPKVSEVSLNSIDSPNILIGEDGNGIDYELQSDSYSPDTSDAYSLEQRRAYKIELQVCKYLCAWIIFSPLLVCFEGDSHFNY